MAEHVSIPDSINDNSIITQSVNPNFANSTLQGQRDPNLDKSLPMLANSYGV